MVKNNCTESQLLALKQLELYATKSENKFSVEDVLKPENSGDTLAVVVSFSSEGFVHCDGGVQLKEKEVFYFVIPAHFPHVKPLVRTLNSEFLLLPHVQWSGDLCLYYSSDREWNPQRGMYGLIERLIEWMKRASENKLEPIEFPLHPPVAFPVNTVEKILIHADCPTFSDQWYGFAKLHIRKHNILSLESWDLKAERNKELINAPAILLNATTNFQEYPNTFDLLMKILASDANVCLTSLMEGLLISMMQGGNENKDMFFMLGTLSRSGKDHTDLKQHLVSWKFPKDLVLEIVKQYRRATRGGKKFHEVYEKVAADIVNDISQWAEAEIEWVRVIENRDEIIQLRDGESYLKELSNKKILLLGCGAIGSKIAYHLARSSVSSLHVLDNGFVKPGLLCRQNFSRDQIGQNKAEALRDSLDKIADFEVHSLPTDAVVKVLENPNFLEEFDIVLDATASNSVLSVLDFARNSGTNFSCASFALSSNADYSMISYIDKGYATSFANLEKKVYLDLLSNSDNRHFIETFWPRSLYNNGVEPEPGCSDPTFIGSDSEVSDLVALMLNTLANQLRKNKLPPSFSYLHTRYRPEKDVEKFDLFLSYQDDVHFRCPNTNFRIFVNTEAQTKIRAIIEEAAHKNGSEKEIGGCLIGNLDLINKRVYVHDVMEAPVDSKASKTEFVFGTEDFDSLEDKINKKYDHQIKWLGHWHTHPNSKPIPSNTDEKAVGQLLKDQSGPILMIIIGLINGDYEYAGYVYEQT